MRARQRDLAVAGGSRHGAARTGGLRVRSGVHLNALRKHDLAHSLPLRQTQRARCLGLAGIDGLDAAAQDLHHVGGGVERDGDEAGGEGAPNLVGLGGLEAHAAQNGEARVIDEQALDHHGRAAHDGGVDGRKAAADAFEKAREVVIHAVERLNAQEHKEQCQKKGYRSPYCDRFKYSQDFQILKK